ncbi:MAG: DUF1653 domain-containing protein [Candidatus Caldatribacteriota bacterium]
MKPIVKVSSNHKNHQQLHQELEEAKKQVEVGGIYSHYKYPENTYQVINLGFIETTDEVCVIYQATYDKELVFVRPLSSWLETPEWNGKKAPRFKRKN